MERAGLRPAPLPPEGRVVRPARGRAVALGVALMAAAAAATLLGADAARRPPTALARAAELVDAALAQHEDSVADTRSLRAIRSDLGARPLDARTRVLYASLLLDRAREEVDRAGARFQATRAAQLAPVTVPVVRAATVVLARAGAGDEALERARAMFAYDPSAAAELLATIEPFLPEGSVDQAVPDLPAAWLAWARRLARNGRGADSQVCLERALTRWPADVGLLEEAAGRAVSRRDWASVDRILPRSTGSPASSLSPRLLALRAWGCAQRGDRDGARADAAEALRRGAGDPMLLSTVGDALAAAGDLDGAAARWTESLYRLPSARAGSALRISLLVRLARLEDERNRPGDALRAWRLVLKADPTLDEARRRVIALGGSW